MSSSVCNEYTANSSIQLRLLRVTSSGKSSRKGFPILLIAEYRLSVLYIHFDGSESISGHLNQWLEGIQFQTDFVV